MNSKNASDKEKFVDMATAKAEVDLLLREYAPQAHLKTAVTVIKKPRFPVIDLSQPSRCAIAAGGAPRHG